MDQNSSIRLNSYRGDIFPPVLPERRDWDNGMNLVTREQMSARLQTSAHEGAQASFLVLPLLKATSFVSSCA